MARAAGALLLGLGAALAVLPAFGWYSAPPAGAPTEASGFAGAGQLWALPVLGALAVLAGAIQLAARPAGAAGTARAAGALAAAAGAVALGVAAWAAADPRLELTALLPGGPERVAAGAVGLEAPAIVTLVVAAAITLVGLALVVSGRRR